MTGFFNVMLLTLIAAGLFTSNLVNAYGKNNGAGFGPWAPDTYYIEIYLQPNMVTKIWSIKLSYNGEPVDSKVDYLTGNQACVKPTEGHGVDQVNDGDVDTYGTFEAQSCGSGQNWLRIQALNAKNFNKVVVSSDSAIFYGQTVVKYRNWCDPFSNNRCSWKTPRQSTATLPSALSTVENVEFTCPLSAATGNNCQITKQPTQAPTQSPTMLTTYSVDIYLRGISGPQFWGTNLIWFVKLFNNGVQIPMSQLSISYPACVDTKVAGVVTPALRAIDTDDTSFGGFQVFACEPADRKITVSSGSNAPFDVVKVSGSWVQWGQRVEMYKTTGGVKTSLYDTNFPTGDQSAPDLHLTDKTVFTFTKP